MPFNAQRLRAIREKRGLTQKQLAEKMGIDHRRIQEYEAAAGKRSSVPGADRLEMLVNALDTNMDYLMNRSSYDGILTEDHRRMERAIGDGDWNGALEIIRLKALNEGRNKGRLPGTNPGSKEDPLKDGERVVKRPRIVKNKK